MKKVLVLLADGFEEVEALSVVDVLRRGNVDCKMCSIGDEYVRGTHNIILEILTIMIMMLLYFQEDYQEQRI